MKKMREVKFDEPELEALWELAGARQIFKDVKRDWEI